MIFSFDHLETPGHVRFDEYNYDLNYLKQYYIRWMKYYAKDCWMSLFYDNHDNPRMVSKVDSRPEYKNVLAKLLGIIQFTLKGTPFLYQGQEFGSVNAEFQSIEEIQDVESINLYNELLKKMDKEKAFKKIIAGTRDHARQPINWEGAENSEIFSFFQKLILLRKQEKALIYGDFETVLEKKKDLFLYYRKGDNVFFVECNLKSNPMKRKYSVEGMNLILSNYKGESKELRPYEGNIYKVEEKRK